MRCARSLGPPEVGSIPIDGVEGEISTYLRAWKIGDLDSRALSRATASSPSMSRIEEITS